LGEKGGEGDTARLLKKKEEGGISDWPATVLWGGETMDRGEDGNKGREMPQFHRSLKKKEREGGSSGESRGQSVGEHLAGGGGLGA